MARYGLGEKVATRVAYGEALRDLGSVNEQVVVLEADIGKSTRSVLFGEAFPERYFNLGVAEQNEMAVAAGLSSCGKIPFVSTYAAFASMRACEQVRTFIAYPRANVKICPSHGGLTPGNDGPTHQATEDLGIMRTIPNMTVCMPTDANVTYRAVFAAAELEGPLYLRLTRDPVPVLNDDDVDFAFGRAIVHRPGGEALIVANGDLVVQALEASDRLAARGVTAGVIDMHTIKPLDVDCLLAHSAAARIVITAEDHQVNGGLGSAVAEALAEHRPLPMTRIGLQDTFAESGAYPRLLAKYGLDADAIEAAVHAGLGAHV